MRYNFLFLLLLTGFSSCNINSSDTPPTLVSLSSFESDLQNWTGEFAGYPLTKIENYKFKLERGKFTTKIGQTYNAAVQTVYVDSGEVFTYLKNRIGGLEPNTSYNVVARIQVYVQLLQDYTGSDLNSTDKGCFLKTGLFTDEPMNDTIADSSVPGGRYINTQFDIGHANSDGADVFFLNKINPVPVGGSPIVFQSMNIDTPIPITSDNDGYIWAVAGLETNLKLYFQAYYPVIEYTFIKN